MIVCMNCQRQMRPKKNGFPIIETIEGGSPYKLFDSDLWECQDCGITVAFISPAQQPISEYWKPDFQKTCNSFAAEAKAKPWTRSAT